MVEVFKTNVNDPAHAKMILDQLHKTFIDYHANFDLNDCDKILRVANKTGMIQSDLLILLLGDFGYKAEIFPDEYPVQQMIHTPLSITLTK